MPIYEYRCENGHTFEVLQRMSDAPVATCETCEAPVQQVFHPIAVHFKGKGFYNTDYGTKNRQRETAAAGEGKGGGEAKGNEGKSGEGKSGEGKSEGSSDGKKGETKKADGAKKAESSASGAKSSSASKSD